MDSRSPVYCAAPCLVQRNLSLSKLKGSEHDSTGAAHAFMIRELGQETLIQSDKNYSLWKAHVLPYVRAAGNWGSWDISLGVPIDASHPVVLKKPEYRLVHPEKYVFSLSRKYLLWIISILKIGNLMLKTEALVSSKMLSGTRFLTENVLPTSVNVKLYRKIWKVQRHYGPVLPF